MIIKSVYIKKFRGFNDVSFDLGTHLTVIAGQNGTQKTTLIGLLSQPFSITDKTNPLHGEKPLSGGNFRSSFAEKFKLSDKFDIAKSHEWTLRLAQTGEPDFTVESINRGKGSKPGIRFWQKGVRSKGSGYIQVPVIYLSLSRLFPIGEDDEISSTNEIILSEKEFEFYHEWHNKILIIPDVDVTSLDYLSSKQKNTIGVNTGFYDWKMNSAGQDNLGKILLAILSFKRLKELHPKVYHGGILAIDELDATLYPASQIKLLHALRKFASNYNVQIIFSTHSLSILETACGWQADPKLVNQIKVIYLQKYDREIRVHENLGFDVIKNKLEVAMEAKAMQRKIPLFIEDKEGEFMLKAMLKSKAKNLKIHPIGLGYTQYVDLAKRKIDTFTFPKCIIALDGDVRNDASAMRQIKSLKQIVVLPGGKSPERVLSEYLYQLAEDSPKWEMISKGYTKQHAFKDYTLKEIESDRSKAKNWFNSQKEYWGRNCARLINLWIAEHGTEVDSFTEKFDELVQKYYQ